MIDSDTTTASTEPKEALDVARITGNFYHVIGTLALIGIAIDFVLGDGGLNGTFFLFFWLGSGLKNHSRVARWWALFAFTCFSIVALWSFCGANSLVHFGPYSYSHPEPLSYAIPALLWTVFAIPSILLLTKNARDTFSVRQVYLYNKAKRGLAH